MEKGSLIYRERARNQDSSQAMGNDLMNALVELLTNADDAYLRNSDYESPIYVACDQSRLFVYDQAGGLPFRSLKSCFTEEGIDTHSDGVTTRGLFGRGAKDCAVFGSVTFVSKHNSGDSWVKVSNSKYEADTGFPVLTGMPKASNLLTKDGLLAVVDVRSRAGNVKLASADKMIVNYAVRKIIERRPVYFSSKTLFTKFVRVVPATWGPVVFKHESTLPSSKLHAEILIRRRPDTRVSLRNFVEIGSSLHALALDRFDLTVSELKDFHVEVQITGLEQYLQQNDQRYESRNPIVKRDRSGLTPDTEFYNDVKQFTESAYREFMLVEQQRKRSEATETLNKQLSNIASKLADQLDNDLEEVDAVNKDSSTGYPSFVPPYISVSIGETKQVALYLREPSSPTKISLQYGPHIDVDLSPRDPDTYQRSSVIDVNITGKSYGIERLAVPIDGETGVLRVDVSEYSKPPEPKLVTGFNPTKIKTHRQTSKVCWYLPEDQSAEITFTAPPELSSFNVSKHVRSEYGPCYKLSLASNDIGDYIITSSENHTLEMKVEPESMKVSNLTVELISGDSTRGYLLPRDGGGHTVMMYADHPALKLSGFSQESYFEGKPNEKPALQCVRETIVNIVIDYLLIKRCKVDLDLISDFETVQMERELLYKKYVQLIGSSSD